MSGLIQNLIVSFPKTISKVLTKSVDKSRLQHTSIKHDDQGTRAHVWESAHSEQSRSRNRMVIDAAMNHWFVCNKGVVNRNAPLTYDPLEAVTESVGRDVCLAKFDRLWDCPSERETPQADSNEHADFWKDFNQSTRTKKIVTSEHFIGGKSDSPRSHGAVKQFTEDPISDTEYHITLEELYNNAQL